MGYLIGAGLALAVGGMGTVVGLDRERAFYSAVLMVVASYYVLFAVIGGSAPVLVVETAVAVVFLSAAVIGFRYSLWLVAAGLALHCVFDVFHGRLIANSGMPEWWPAFCLAYDGVAAVYLALLLRRARVPVFPRPAAP